MIPRTLEEFKAKLTARADLLRKHGILAKNVSFKLYRPRKNPNHKYKRGPQLQVRNGSLPDSHAVVTPEEVGEVFGDDIVKE